MPFGTTVAGDVFCPVYKLDQCFGMIKQANSLLIVIKEGFKQEIDKMQQECLTL